MTSITTRIETIFATNKSLVKRTTEYAIKTRKLTWELMAEVYALGIESIQPENAIEFDQLLETRRLKPAKEGENRWLKVLNVSCGEHVERKKGKKVVQEWHVNQSMSKYARALRLMEDQGVDPANALAFIADEKEWVDTGSNGNRRHLIGMIAADKIKHPAKGRTTTKPELIALAARQAAAGVEVADAPSNKRRVYARAFGFFENGQFFYVGALPNSETTARLDANKLGKSLVEASDKVAA